MSSKKILPVIDLSSICHRPHATVYSQATPEGAVRGEVPDVSHSDVAERPTVDFTVNLRPGISRPDPNAISGYRSATCRNVLFVPPGNEGGRLIWQMTAGPSAKNRKEPLTRVISLHD